MQWGDFTGAGPVHTTLHYTALNYTTLHCTDLWVNCQQVNCHSMAMFLLAIYLYILPYIYKKIPYHNYLLYFYIKLISYRVFMFFIAHIFIGLTFFVFQVNVTDSLKVLRLVYDSFHHPWPHTIQIGPNWDLSEALNNRYRQMCSVVWNSVV